MSKYGHNETTKKKESWKVPEPKVRPEPNSFNRVDLDPSKFDLLIQQKGMMCKIYRTVYCPNVKSVDGAEHEIDCTMCNGSGFYDFDPICTYVFIQHQELDKLPNIDGLVDGNTVKMTFPIGVEMQYFTKIELHDQRQVFFQRVMKNPDSSVDILKYPACTVNAIIGKRGLRYYQGIDFELDLNGNIKWLSLGDQQLITFSLVPDSGSFTLSFAGNSTGPIAFDATATDVQTELRSLEGLEDVIVSGDFTLGFKVTYVGVDSPIPSIGAGSSLFNGATLIDVSFSNALKKSRKPNDYEPYSIHYQATVVYRAMAALHANRYTQYAQGSEVQQIKMPEEWYAKKEFLLKRTDKFTGVELQQGPYDRHSIVVEDGGTEAGNGLPPSERE